MPEPNGRISSSGVLRGVMSIGGAGTDNYEDLNHLPQVNGVELKGNKTTEELSINIPTKTSDLNNDSGYVNSSIVANPYDETSTYAVGVYVTHENNLYKCNTAIETAEEWNAEHWTLVDVISAIPTKTSDLDNDSGFASIDDTSTANNKAWSASKIDTELSGKVGKVETPSYNLFDGTFYSSNGYLKSTGFVSNSGYRVTTPIYLAVGSYYYLINKTALGNNSIYYARTDQEETTFTILAATDTEETATINQKAFTAFAFTVSTAGYFAFNCCKNDDYNYVMVVSQSEGIPTEYSPYQERTTIQEGVNLSETLKDEILELYNLNPLYKKSLSSDGDSICNGTGTPGGFAKIITENNLMTNENLGVSGATIVAETYKDGGVARHWVCRSMQNISSDADYILIEGGVNDVSLQVALGSLSNGYNATLDDTTFYGAVETIFKTLTTKYAGKKYGFIIVHGIKDEFMSGGTYHQAVIECGQKWGVKILDLSLSVPPFNKFRNDATYDTIREAYTNSGDGWHPTTKCYEEYYVPQIESFLKTL